MIQNTKKIFEVLAFSVLSIPFWMIQGVLLWLRQGRCSSFNPFSDASSSQVSGGGTHGLHLSIPFRMLQKKYRNREINGISSFNPFSDASVDVIEFEPFHYHHLSIPFRMLRNHP